MTAKKQVSLVHHLAILASAASLAVCLIAPVFCLTGRWEDVKYKAVLLAGSIGWFVCAAVLTATNYANRAERQCSASKPLH